MSKSQQSRIDYLIGILHSFMHKTSAGSETIFYDDADCDGYCLTEDIAGEIDFVKSQRDDLLEALEVLLEAVNGKHVTVGDCNQAAAAIAKAKGDA